MNSWSAQVHRPCYTLLDYLECHSTWTCGGLLNNWFTIPLFRNYSIDGVKCSLYADALECLNSHLCAQIHTAYSIDNTGKPMNTMENSVMCVGWTHDVVGEFTYMYTELSSKWQSPSPRWRKSLFSDSSLIAQAFLWNCFYLRCTHSLLLVSLTLLTVFPPLAVA